MLNFIKNINFLKSKYWIYNNIIQKNAIYIIFIIYFLFIIYLHIVQLYIFYWKLIKVKIKDYEHKKKLIVIKVLIII